MTTNFDETRMVEGLINRDENSFKSLVDKYQDYVIKISYSITGNIHDAEDIAQEVFIEIFFSAKKFKYESKLSTWIYRITINKTLNFLRSNRNFRFIISIDNILKNEKNFPIYAPRSDDSDYQVENDEMKILLNSAIKSLSDTQRIAFSLHKFEGMSYNDVSEIMELSLSAVESIIHRAKKKLQKSLYSYYKKNSF